MSLTLVEASAYSNSVLSQGVVETFVKDDPILERMKFKGIKGNSFDYIQEATYPSGKWYGVNEKWEAGKATGTKQHAVLKIIGVPVELDDFEVSTQSGEVDLKSDQIQKAIKGVKETFMESFYYGINSSNSNEPDGIHQLIASSTYNTVLADGSDTATVVLSLSSHLDKAIDMIKGFTPSMIISSKGMRRAVTKYLRSAGSIATGRDEFSRPVTIYNGIPWYTSDYIRDTELTSSGAFSAKTGGYTTSIFVLSFEPDAMEGLQVRPMETLPWADTQDGNMYRARIRWYPSWMMKSLISCAKVVGLDADGTVAA